MQLHPLTINKQAPNPKLQTLNFPKTHPMKRQWIFLLWALQLTACDPATLQHTLGTVLEQGDELSPSEVAAGLKQALEIGIAEGAQKLAREGGYLNSPYRIDLPPEARKVADKLKNVPGFSSVEQRLLEKINRGAEDAARRAAPIFKQAIAEMSFQDAMDILMGADTAATAYLRRATWNKLYEAFNPVIVESLDRFQARKYWADAVNAYNAIPFVEKVNAELDDYVTREALEGLFEMVALKERQIRHDVSARTTDLLRRVFARQDR